MFNEHPTVGQASVNWHRGPALCPAPGREDEVYFHISPLDQSSDPLFQILPLGPCISYYKEDSIVRKVLQGELDSWGQKGFFYIIWPEKRLGTGFPGSHFFATMPRKCIGKLSNIRA